MGKCVKDNLDVMMSRSSTMSICLGLENFENVSLDKPLEKLRRPMEPYARGYWKQIT
jgi:hypothetical protein